MQDEFQRQLRELPEDMRGSPLEEVLQTACGVDLQRAKN
jgi:hypothetical protein